jgi:hypothetical protein
MQRILRFQMDASIELVDCPGLYLLVGDVTVKKQRTDKDVVPNLN